MGRLRAFNDTANRELNRLTSMLMTMFSITMDFLMYLANTILAKLDDSYRQGSKRVKRIALRR